MNEDPVDRLLKSATVAKAGEAHADDRVLLELARGALEPAEAATTEAHLAACTECRALWLELREAAPAAPLERPGEVIRLPARRIALGVLAAAAAGLLAVLLLPRSVSSLPKMELDPLPPGLAEVRGTAEEQIPRYAPEAELELVVRSEAVLEDSGFEASVFTLSKGRITAIRTTAEKHTLRIFVRAAELGPSGELIVAVGRGAPMDLRALGEGERARAFNVFRRRFELAGMEPY